jgi:hypothetical protein
MYAALEAQGAGSPDQPPLKTGVPTARTVRRGGVTAVRRSLGEGGRAALGEWVNQIKSACVFSKAP